MKPSEVMTKALALIEDGRRWTKGAYARNNRGARVPPTDPSACRFCAMGAVSNVTGNTPRGRDMSRGVATYLTKGANGRTPEAVNDANKPPEYAHMDVVQMFRKGIVLALKEGQ